LALPDVDLSALPVPAQKALAPEAPAPLRTMAARGVLPGLKPGDIVIVVSVLASSADAAIAQTARTTLEKLPTPVLAGALTVDLPGSVIEKLAEARPREATVVLALLKMPRVTTAALEHLAAAADEPTGEIIATNEELMLAHPTVIEKLYMNKQVRMSTADRLIELAVRNGIELGIPAFKEAAAAIMNELIPEPSEEPTFDDLHFKQVEEIAAQVALEEGEDTHEVDEEGEEQVKKKVLPLHAEIAACSVSEKIRRATLGTSTERLLLVRDSNRLVAAAAAKSPGLKESEAVQISASRAVSDEVLRIIAMNRDLVRSYQVKMNLVQNPRTPFTFASRLVPHLRDSDLRALARSKNVSAAVAQIVQQQISRKQKAG
jgi:CTP:molybdopterin cytidylyltransferase MocA